MNSLYEQPDLFSKADWEQGKLAKRFWGFHAANPEVYASLVRLAREFRRMRPAKNIGIALLYERLRWDFTMQTLSDDEFKLTNDYRAFYSRLIMQREPDLAGLFVTKESVADSAMGGGYE
jgi:hypothetical protein